MKGLFFRLFSTSAAGLYIILFAVAIGAATFIENDFGTSAAQKVVYRARWFELLLVLFSITLIVNIVRFRMVQQRKWPILTFHAAMIIILIGAAVTRYYGYEGIMHIREGSASGEIISADTYLKFEVMQGDKTYRFDESVYFASLGKNSFREEYQIGNEVILVEVTDFVPNPAKTLTDTPGGVPTLKIVIGGMRGREEYFMRLGDGGSLRGTRFSFSNAPRADAVSIVYRNDSLFVHSPVPLVQTQMATQQRDSLSAMTLHPLMLRTLYTGEEINFVIGEFSPRGEVVMTSASRKMKNESIAAVNLRISNGRETSSTYLFGNKGMEGKPEQIHLGNLHIAATYGAKRIQLPFEIRLREFIMDRYPGTNSASSYASEVTLIDRRHGIERDFRIYMNNILDYGGYRFFQSSYDQDELGTVLSVNHDFWGTWISYIGYGLLTLGMILTLLSKRSRFYDLSKKLRALRNDVKPLPASLIVAGMLATTGIAHANALQEHKAPVIPSAHASEFSRLVMQDHRGRMKPMHTLCSEVLRKLARKEKLHGQNASQIILGMMIYPEEWSKVSLIKTGKHTEIQKILNVRGELAAFDDFFTPEGQYLLKEYVRESYSREPVDRTAFDKEIIKLDERVNICNMIFTGKLMRLFPMPGAQGDEWYSPADVSHTRADLAPNPFVQRFFPAYLPTVRTAMQSNDWSLANDLIAELNLYQHQHGGHLVPVQQKIDLEILLNKSNVFARLGEYYGLLGILFLVVFFARVFNHRLDMKWPLRIAMTLLAVCFLMHTLGLGVRWYVSGRAPWSNGYESMIYIGWTTVLAGLIFARKSMGGLTATAVLASTILMVASLSYLDPEITPLVPVLRSYWLTIHVSLEAGSYGFLMLGAIIGVLNLMLMTVMTAANKERVLRMVKEMSYISEMTLIGGLFMISTGTYLGGIWANESWGRYWGWDAKETWALVTILVYAFILHMRFIPGLRGFYAFNVASLFGFASVIMTYFGVNYYLSGLHSYAAGDPVPIPQAVYITALSFLVLSVAARWRWGALKV